MTQTESQQTDKQNKVNPHDFTWKYWFIVPIYPYSTRRTIRKEVLKDTIWTFEQLQGIFYVVVPIRMTVIKLQAGGLFVYAPVAPTGECIALLRELEAQHGAVKYIILPTISGLEHKVFVGPFARYFPQATVYVAPKQWSFPLNLPLSWLGLPRDRTKILPEDSQTTPFAREFDYQILGDIDLNLGRFEEVTFFHTSTQTLLVTDLLISIPANPPSILQLEPYPLLFHARDSARDKIEDTETNRRQGWQRICLFALYFQPTVLKVRKWRETFADSLKAADRSPKAYFGLYPFQWENNWQQCFENLRKSKLLVAPILQTLILNRAKQKTQHWLEKIVNNWQIARVIPSHFASPIAATIEDVEQAFSFLSKLPEQPNLLPEKDFQTLRNIDRLLTNLKIVPPAE